MEELNAVDVDLVGGPCDGATVAVVGLGQPNWELLVTLPARYDSWLDTAPAQLVETYRYRVVIDLDRGGFVGHFLRDVDRYR